MKRQSQSSSLIGLPVDFVRPFRIPFGFLPSAIPVLEPLWGLWLIRADARLCLEAWIERHSLAFVWSSVSITDSTTAEFPDEIPAEIAVRLSFKCSEESQMHRLAEGLPTLKDSIRSAARGKVRKDGA